LAYARLYWPAPGPTCREQKQMLFKVRTPSLGYEIYWTK
jgi:hypothetical protein